MQNDPVGEIRGDANVPASGGADGSSSTPVGRLRRWTAAGGAWAVVARTPGRVEVALLRCDGGEEVERLVSDDPGLLAFVASSSDGGD